MANRPSEPQGDADLIWECIYDHGNGKYKGEKSAAQRAEAFAALERLKAQSAEGPSMTDKTTAMTELPEPELGYIETDKSRQPAFSARQMREALQSAQPAAAVSDEAIYAVWTQHCQTPGTTARQLVCAFARAILALRPQAVPMTDEQIRSMCKQGWVFETVRQWVHVVEAHHGITAPAGGEKQA